MRKLLDGIYLTTAWLGALSVLAICLLMVAQSIARELGVRTGGTNDAVAWLCAASAFLPMAHAFKHGDFVRVTLLLEKLSRRSRKWFEVTSLLIAAISVTYLAWWATKFTLESWQFNEVSTGLLVLPLWIPQISFVAGSWVFVLAVVDEVVMVLQGNDPTYVTAVEARHAAGDFSSDI